MTPSFIASMIIAYLLGSIPSAYLVARTLRGVDIRTLGDGNPGGKNVYHVISPPAGVAVMVMDAGKGTAAMVLARTLGVTEIALLWVGIAAIVGHDWPLFLHFQGGQGMATTVGVFLVLMPAETILSLAVIAAWLWLSRNWDLSWGIGFASFPVWAWWMHEEAVLIIYPVVLLPLIGIRKWMQHVLASREDAEVKLNRPR